MLPVRIFFPLAKNFGIPIKCSNNGLERSIYLSMVHYGPMIMKKHVINGPMCNKVDH